MSRSSARSAGVAGFAPAGAAHEVRTVATVRIWDRFVRVFHWTLVGAFFVAWFSTESIGLVHKTAGYLAIALVIARIVWGFVGSRHARFASFVPSPRVLLGYVRALVRGREPRCAGHNPLGALMILLLMAAVLTIGISGWMLTLDAFWGNETVETMHTWAVDATLLAVVLHATANVAASLRHRENLIASMITGRKPVVSSARTEDDLSDQLET
jgi:cytochrome b